jgi:hypothetical protein
MKQPFINRAVWYAIKDQLDDATKRFLSGPATGKQALLELGMPLWAIERTDWSAQMIWYSTDPTSIGTYMYRPFDAAMLVGVDPYTYQDNN